MTTATLEVEKNVQKKNIGKNAPAALLEKSVDANVYAERVEKKAYELYEKRGRQDGHDVEDWLEAQQIVEAEMIGMD